jgi:hypothetical protein
MILEMEIVWFISFWSCDVFAAINLSSTTKECKGFIGGWHEKISISFWTERGAFCFGLWFLFVKPCFKDECSWQEVSGFLIFLLLCE